MVVSHSAPRSALGTTSPEGASPRSLLGELGGEYPELSRREVATALDRAYAIEAALAAGAEVVLARVATLARDRLEVLRERANVVRRQTTLRAPTSSRFPPSRR